MATGSVVVSGRTMNSVAPNSPSEIANAKPGRDQRRARGDPEVHLEPDPAGRRAEHGGGLAEPGVDGLQDRKHHAHDEGDRDECVRDRDDRG